MILFAAAAVLSGCAVGEQAKLGRDIAIDGIDVSGLRVYEARSLLQAEHERRLGVFCCTVYGREEGEVRLTAGALGATAGLDEALLRAAGLRARDRDRDLRTQWTVDSGALSRAVNSVAEQFDALPVSATVTWMEEGSGFCYTKEAEGCLVDRQELQQRILTALQSQQSCAVELPCEALLPRRTQKQLQGQRTLLASFATSFSASSLSGKSRVYNIKKAAGRIHGLALVPGEEFDCNGVLGDRSAENGWREAAAISYGTYVQEYGGGVCQVSSTLFNAVLMADLEVLERSPHSWPMKYVPIGRDATISTGGKNFRFRNNTQSTVYIALTVDENEKTVTACLYGEPMPEGQYITITSELVKVLDSPDTEVCLDATLPAGSEELLREPRQGKVSRTYKEYRSADGAIIRRTLAYEDTYRSINGILAVSADRYFTDNYS